jgi:hypothetical protein
LIYIVDIDGTDMAWKIEARKRGSVGFEPDKSEMEIIITPPTNPNMPGQPG